MSEPNFQQKPKANIGYHRQKKTRSYVFEIKPILREDMKKESEEDRYSI